MAKPIEINGIRRQRQKLDHYIVAFALLVLMVAGALVAVNV